MKTAVASRLFGFDAGPHNHTFYACADHASRLTTEAPSSCFHVLPSQPVIYRECSDVECDYCRGEEGPS